MSRTNSGETTWYAIDHCNVYGKPGVDLAGKVYLGRPWRVLARAIYQNTELSNIINPKGWTTMAEGATPLYYEYNNKGAGSSTSRREYESAISGAVSQNTVLGSDWNSWVDTKY
jgi:pectinesterase